MIRTGGARYPRVGASETPTLDESGNVCHPDFLHMDGPEIFNFTLHSVPGLVNEVIGKAGLRFDQVDYFVFHQANAYMLEHLRRKLGIPKDRFAVCLEHYGNTVSATIPVALNAAIEAGQIKAGMKILLAGFGVGLSWGACMLEWEC
jgi:3-oxoacyl-[acyl-carrier-protein] synthase-3